MAVVGEAWDLIRSMIGAGGGGGGGGSGGGGSNTLDALATVDKDVLDILRRLQEKLLIVLYGPGSPGAPPPGYQFGDPTDAGVKEAKAVFDLDIEDFDPLHPEGFGAKFTVRAETVKLLSYMHISFSYDAKLFGCTYDISAALKAAGFKIDKEAEYENPKITVVDGMTVVSLYVHTAAPSVPAATGAIDLLEVFLYPKDYTKSYAGTASVGLNHIDITYGANSPPADANVRIYPTVGVAWINYFSKYDVNRDGKITLADVDLVRRNMGKSESASPDWSSPLVHRCDLNGDKKIDFLDLAIIIGAYEENLP
jgi:hypothetical protein